MKKIIALASAALIFSACDEDSTSASPVNLGTKFLSARNVIVDEANQTIDMAMPICSDNGGSAVLTEIASGPSPYTISNGKLSISNSSFKASGSNSSIIGVWDIDVNDVMSSSNADFNYGDMGFKMYLDIGKNNFDLYANSDNVCLAKVMANEMLGDSDAEDMTIESQECNKLVVKVKDQKITIETDPSIPVITMKLSILSYTCEMKVSIEQASEKNCTDANLDAGNFDKTGMFLQSMEYSKACSMFDLEKTSNLAKKALRKINVNF